MDNYQTLKNFFNKYSSNLDGTFYYDETNNFRKFHLRASGFNNDFDKYFVLGGLWVRNNIDVNTDNLFKLLKPQKNFIEFKFEYFSRGRNNFIDILKSDRLNIFLKWLSDSKISIHISVLNYLYYSLVDIIDSVTTEQEIHEFGPKLLNLFKNALYIVIKNDIEAFANLFYKYGYPNIQKEELSNFNNNLYDLYEYAIDNFNGNEMEKFYIECVRQMLKRARKQDEMIFLHDNENYALMGRSEFTSKYFISILKFSNVCHIFDEEQQVQEDMMNSYEEYLKENSYNYKFVDSREELFVQFSDVVVGLFSKYYTFLENGLDTNYLDLLPLSKIHLENYNLMITLLNNSIKYSKLTSSFVGPISTMEKHHKFLEFIRKYTVNI